MPLQFANLTPTIGGFGLRRPRKQRHTAKRILVRLRDEYGKGGGYTTVKDYVREHRRQTREVFVPLSHPPGRARCDFGEALVVIGGVERKAHCFVIDLPNSDGCFMKAYPSETTEAFCVGHVSAFAGASFSTIPGWPWRRHWETAHPNTTGIHTGALGSDAELTVKEWGAPPAVKQVLLVALRSVPVETEEQRPAEWPGRLTCLLPSHPVTRISLLLPG